MTTALPRTRSIDLVLRTVGDEAVVYDTAADTAHALSPSAAQLWPLLDGATTVSAATERLGISEAEVAATVVALDDAGLLAAGHDRRAFLTRAAVVAGGVLAFPVVTSLAAPLAAAAASNVGGPVRGGTADLYTAASGGISSASAGPFSFARSATDSTAPPSGLTAPTSTFTDAPVSGIKSGPGAPDFPLWAVNPSGAPYSGTYGNLPATSFGIHPDQTGGSTAISYSFPAGTTTYSVSGNVSDTNTGPGGSDDGVRYAVYDGTVLKTSGTVGPGGSSAITVASGPQGTGPLVLLIDRNGDYAYDSTRVDLTVTTA